MPLPVDARDELGARARYNFEAVRDQITRHKAVVVAFSGGADSALLAWIANEVLSPGGAVAVTAISASLAGSELEHCRGLAAAWGLDWRHVETDEFTNPDYLRNDAQRCFHCKQALMDAITPIAAESNATVLLGVNTDDLGDHRPGQRAAAQRGAAFPFVEANLSKADVRELSRQLGLETWDKPAAPCLASRLPYGTPVTMRRLSQVERAERVMRELGFGDVRVRHYDETARIEVPDEAFAQVLGHRKLIVERLQQLGFDYVTIDLEPLRSGNLNRALLATVPDQSNRIRTA